MEVVGKVGISLTVEVSDLDKCNCYRVELQVRGKYSDFECNGEEFFSINYIQLIVINQINQDLNFVG